MFRQTRGKSYCCRHSCCSCLLLLVLLLVSGSRYGGVYVMFCTRVGVAKQMAKLLNVIASEVQCCACVCVCQNKQTHTHSWRKHNTLAGIKNGVLTSETCWSPYDDVASSHCHLLIPPPSSFCLPLLSSLCAKFIYKLWLQLFLFLRVIVR